MLLTEADIARLAAHLALPERTFIERFCALARNRAQLTLIERDDGACVFLDGRDCRIYPARPSQCRAFPEGWSVSGCSAAEGGGPSGR